MGKIVADIHRGDSGKATIGTHLVFLAVERGAKTLFVDLDANDAFDNVAQRRLRPALIRTASEPFDDIGFEGGIFYAAEKFVTSEGHVCAWARKQFAKLLDT